MKLRNVFIEALLILLLIQITGYSQEVKLGEIIILPFSSEGIDQITLNTSQEILRIELVKLSEKKIRIDKSFTSTINESDCNTQECIISYGKKIKADQIATCNFLLLGQKIIIQYTLYDIAGNKIIISDSIISMSVEELDVVMKRIAMSMVQIESAKLTAEKGVIIEEEAKKPLLRGGGTFYGLSFGYLFPLTGFGDSERSFTFDFKIGTELENYDYGLLFFVRQGFGVNIYSSYLLTKDDFCPYIGGGLGFHWINGLHNSSYYYIDDQFNYNQDKRKEDGFELQLNAGMRLFNTYNMKITLNCAFSHSFNDYKSDSFVFTIGFLR